MTKKSVRSYIYVAPPFPPYGGPYRSGYDHCKVAVGDAVGHSHVTQNLTKWLILFGALSNIQ